MPETNTVTITLQEYFDLRQKAEMNGSQVSRNRQKVLGLGSGYTEKGNKMTDRERLLQILNVPIYPHELVDPLEAVADYLLDNGVTFATENNVGSKWIPVSERLPEEKENVLAWCDNEFSEVCYYSGQSWEKAWDNEEIFFVTHWMPLPEPPGK